MARRSLLAGIRSRVASILSGWWTDLYFFWHTDAKGPAMVFSVGGLALALTGTMMTSAYTHWSDRDSLRCLATNIYYESRGEPRDGQFAVAEVTMNRVASPNYPKTVCEVVHQKNWDYRRKRYVGAFSWTEFDQLDKPAGDEWQRAREVAELVYYGRHTPQVAGALHYHAVYVHPSWARKKKPITRIGRHVFYV